MTRDLKALLLAASPIPDELVSEEQFQRFHHLDVSALTRTDIERELALLRVLNFVGGTEWHEERERLLEARLLA